MKLLLLLRSIPRHLPCPDRRSLHRQAESSLAKTRVPYSRCRQPNSTASWALPSKTSLPATTSSYHEDEVFAQASSIKITVLANLYLQAQQGKLKLTDLYTVQSSDLVPDSDIMGGLTPGVTRLTLRDLATMMVAVSDNSADQCAHRPRRHAQRERHARLARPDSHSPAPQNDGPPGRQGRAAKISPTRAK